MPDNDANREDIDNFSTDQILEEMEEDKKQLKRSSVLAISALIAIIALCLAWFASNNWVKGIINGVSVDDDTQFVLASVGTRQAAEQEYLKDETGKNLLSVAWNKTYGKYIDVKTGKTISKEQNYQTGNSSLAWFLNGQESLVPGNGGKFEFYLIPKRENLKSVTVSLNLTMYTVPDNEKRAVKLEDEKIQNLLDGHVLLFENLDDEYGYTGWLGAGHIDSDNNLNNKLTITAPAGENNGTGTFEKNVPYKVTVYWVWPKYFRNYIYTQRSTQEDLFTDKVEQGEGSEYKQLIDFINTQKSLGKTGKLFYSKAAGATAVTDSINNQMSDSVLDACNQYYNEADEYIGDSTVKSKYVYIEMKVEE